VGDPLEAKGGHERIQFDAQQVVILAATIHPRKDRLATARRLFPAQP
jgi:hypothetical protein